MGTTQAPLRIAPFSQDLSESAKTYVEKDVVGRVF